MLEDLGPILVFVIALLGAFFHGVKEENGARKYFRSWIPIPTFAGALTVICLILALWFSLWLTHKGRVESKQREQQAIASQVELQGRLENLTAKNDALQTALSHVAQSNLEQANNILTGQQVAHSRNMERLAAVLSRQESLARTSERNAARNLAQLGADIRIAVELVIPARQMQFQKYTDYVRAKMGNTVAYAIDDDERGPLASEIRFVRLYIYFFNHRINPLNLDDPRVISDLTFASIYDLTDEPDFFEKPIGKINQTIALSSLIYSRTDDQFQIEYLDIQPQRMPSNESIRSVPDLRGSQCVIRLTVYSSVDIQLKDVALTGPSLPIIEISGFRLVSKDKAGETATWEAIVK